MHLHRTWVGETLRKCFNTLLKTLRVPFDPLDPELKSKA